MPSAAWLVAGALLLVGAGIAWTTQAVASEESVVSTREIDAWSEDARFTYAVPVQGETEPLPMGEPGYFTTRSPVLPVVFTWSAQDPHLAPIAGSGRLDLVIVATAAGAEAWRIELPQTAAAIADARVDLTGIVDFANAERAVEDARLENGKRNETLTWSLVASIDYTRALAASTSQFTFPIQYDAPLYVLPNADAAHHTRPHGEIETTVHTSIAGARGILVDPRGPAALAAGLAVLYLAHRRARTEAPA